jgi:succinyl-diaminopimelate desuccinylase
MTMLADPLPLAQDLMTKPSVTPIDAGAMDVLEGALKALGFRTKRYPFGAVDNLYARLGETAPNLCFAGHTDVVPVGDLAAWTSDPFAPAIREGYLFGRGAADMKAAIACFVAATARVLDKDGAPNGSISFLITGDEEGPALDGTKKLLAAIAAEGETLSHCIVGEPTNPHALGDMIKNGRRGSLNGKIVARGIQGHVAYPDKAANPIPPLLAFLSAITARTLDAGVPGFQASNLEVVTIDVGNTASNVIPAEARAAFNIRFNTAHTGQSLVDWLEGERAKAAAGFKGALELSFLPWGESFLTPPGPFTTIIQDACEAETGRRPALSTTGGTSDARFIKDYCPVADFGLVGATMHQVDERVAVSDIETLTRIYERLIRLYFSRMG